MEPGRAEIFGVITELSTGYPGYDSIIGPENATIGEILKENSYARSWFGKNHNTPASQIQRGRSFHQWPSGMGFDYCYGFYGRRDRAVAAVPVPRSYPDLPVALTEMDLPMLNLFSRKSARCSVARCNESSA
jgi:arylsulfatase A-like enzyme